MTLDETITYYQKVVESVPKTPVPSVGRWCIANHIKEVLGWLQEYRVLKVEVEQIRKQNQDLKKLLRWADEDFDDVSGICDSSSCQSCPNERAASPENPCRWKHHKRAMVVIKEGET